MIAVLMKGVLGRTFSLFQWEALYLLVAGITGGCRCRWWWWWCGGGGGGGHYGWVQVQVEVVTLCCTWPTMTQNGFCVLG